MVIVLCWFGTISVMLALIPSVAILPILLYIGMLIGSQAFQETPRSHAPAIVLALVPHLANWGLTQINNALAAAGTVVGGAQRRADGRTGRQDAIQGVLYDGLHVLGGGSILGGLILGAIAVFIIDRDFMKAAGFALAGAVLTFFGFMHGEQIGIGQTPTVAVSYLVDRRHLYGLSPVRPAARDVDGAGASRGGRGPGGRTSSALGVTESPVDAAPVHAKEPRRLHHVAGGLLQRALDERLFGRFEVQGQARWTARRERRPAPDAAPRANQAKVARLDRLAARSRSAPVRSCSSARARCRETYGSPAARARAA